LKATNEIEEINAFDIIEILHQIVGAILYKNKIQKVVLRE